MATNNLRVLVLAHVFPRTLGDSMGAFLLHLADALAGCGVQIDVVAPHEKKLSADEMIGVARVHRFRYALTDWEQIAYKGTMHEIVGRGVGGKILFAIFTLAFFFKILRVARAAHPKILHAHWWLPGGLVGGIASIITRTPLVITTHGTDVEMLRRTRWAIPLARFVFARARVVTCGSNYLREQLLALQVVNSSKVFVIPMPVNPVFESRQSMVNSRRSNLILTIARLTAQKSIDTLLDAMALIPHARLQIIGDGPERAALEKQTRDLNLLDRVEFLGALPQVELPAHYAACAVFALPSIREGMGLVFAEALLCGAPVIAAHSGGVTDIVKDGETGLLVPERDAAALAATIERMLNDRALAERMASKGATWVKERYTRQHVAEQFAEIYNLALIAEC